jgi:hypothetical protein
MKHSLIYKMDLADSNMLKKRVSTLLQRSVSILDRTQKGVVPAPRDGHSANLYKNSMVIFGGDRNKYPFNDLFFFHLEK